MLTKENLTILFSFILLFLTGCTALKAVATSDSSLLTPPATLASATSTPVCVNEPDANPDNFAALVFPDSLTEIDGGRESPSPWTSPQIKDGLTFYISGVYAINREIAFIFGGLKVPGGTIGSLLLRTEDGGVHWKEVLNPISYHDITHVVFISNGEGWAIATWTREGNAGTRLWHTTDYGETWQESPGHPPSGFGIRVFDSKHLQVKFLDWWANPNTDKYMIWDSYDGGTTWSESFDIPVNDANVHAVVEAYADMPGGSYGHFYQCDVWKTVCTAYGQDGSIWQIHDVYEKTCISETGSEYHGKLIYAKVSHVWLEKETPFAIPVYFSYQDNQIRVKP